MWTYCFYQYSEYIFAMNVLNKILVNGHMETNAAII